MNYLRELDRINAIKQETYKNTIQTAKEELIKKDENKAVEAMKDMTRQLTEREVKEKEDKDKVIPDILIQI